MPTINDLKQSRFLTKGDVGKGMLLTIKGWHEENVALRDDPAEVKYCLDFEETPKPMVLNSTNGNIIASITGQEDLDHWTGFRIVAFHDPTIAMGGKLVGGIRVRAPRIAPVPPPPGPARPPAPKPAPVSRPAPVPMPQDFEGPEAAPEGDDVPF